jgi:hypothetical protein
MFQSVHGDDRDGDRVYILEFHSTVTQFITVYTIKLLWHQFLAHVQGILTALKWVSGAPIPGQFLNHI